jgi:hypothetical protein
VSSLRSSTKLRAALVALLALNGIGFALHGSVSKAVDSAAWLALLMLFLAETQFSNALKRPARQLLLRAARLVAAAGVVGAAIGYIVQGNRLDAMNSALWIAVVLLLETEIRWPAVKNRARIAFGSIAVALYGGLAALVCVWFLRAEWIDAYDAALWLVAFAAVELDLMRAS